MLKARAREDGQLGLLIAGVLVPQIVTLVAAEQADPARRHVSARSGEPDGYIVNVVLVYLLRPLLQPIQNDQMHCRVFWGVPA